MPIGSDFGSRVQFRSPRTGEQVAEGLQSPVPDSDQPWSRTLAAVLDGRLIGLGILALTPAMGTYYCDVSVSPSYRRRGIGTELFLSLQRLADPSLPILGRAMSSQPLRRHFAEHLGATVLMHCPMPGVDLTSAAARHWAASRPLPAGYKTTAMA